jgi:hypothetical protein
MTIVFIDAEAKDSKQISEEVLQDSTKACVVYNIELAAFQSLENYLKENTKGKLFTQFSIAEPVPGDVFLIDENHEINFNGRQIELKRKEDNSFNYNFKSIVESSLNEVYIFKAEDYKFEFVNKGGLDNMGYSLQEMLDMTPIDIKPEMTFEKNRLYLTLFIKERIKVDIM